MYVQHSAGPMYEACICWGQGAYSLILPLNAITPDPSLGTPWGSTPLFSKTHCCPLGTLHFFRLLEALPSPPAVFYHGKFAVNEGQSVSSFRRRWTFSLPLSPFSRSPFSLSPFSLLSISCYGAVEAVTFRTRVLTRYAALTSGERWNEKGRSRAS